MECSATQWSDQGQSVMQSGSNEGLLSVQARKLGYGQLGAYMRCSRFSDEAAASANVGDKPPIASSNTSKARLGARGGLSQCWTCNVCLPITRLL